MLDLVATTPVLEGRSDAPQRRIAREVATAVNPSAWSDPRRVWLAHAASSPECSDATVLCAVYESAVMEIREHGRTPACGAASLVDMSWFRYVEELVRKRTFVCHLLAHCRQHWPRGIDPSRPGWR